MPEYLSFYSTGRNKPDQFTLPPLLMVLLSPFSNLPYRKIIHFSFIMDCLITLTIFLFLISVYQINIDRAVICSLIYLLTPINCTTTVSLTPRPLGLLLFLFFTVFTTMYFEDKQVLYFILSCFCITGLLLSQRMITQILVIVSPFVVLFYTIFYKYNMLFILFSVFMGIILALVITKGQYKKIFLDHYNRIKLHYIHGDQNNFSKKIGNPLRIIKANPWLLFLIVILYPGFSFPENMYVIVGYLFGIIILTELWIFGNGINHIYFTAPLISILLSSYIFSVSISHLLIIMFSIGCLIIVIREFSNMKKEYIGKDWFDCFDFINNNKLKGYAMVLPTISYSPLIYYTDMNLISAGHGSKAMSFNRLYLKKNMIHPKDLKHFIEDLKPDYLLIEKDKFDLSSWLLGEKNNEVGLVKLYENKSVAFLSLDKTQEYMFRNKQERIAF